MITRQSCERRCVVPFTSFSEKEAPDGSRPRLVAVDESGRSHSSQRFGRVGNRFARSKRARRRTIFRLPDNGAERVLHRSIRKLSRDSDEARVTAPTKDPMTLQRPLADDALRSREARDKTGRAKGEGRNLQARTSFSRAAAIDPCRP